MHLLAFGTIGIGGEVCNPNVAFMIYVNTMGCCEYPSTKIGQHFACIAVELKNRINQVIVAIDRATGSTTAGTTSSTIANTSGTVTTFVVSFT